MVNVVKASGEKALFDIAKVRRSLARVGADPDLVDEIARKVEQSVTDGMTTRMIYRTAFRLLGKHSKTLAAKFHLKRAILRLGTSGFPFEKYLAEILRYGGMGVELNKIMKGRCINHEVDLFVKHGEKTIFVECKYHNLQGIKTDVKVALYFKSRFQDLKESAAFSRSPTLAGWLVTNTRFSSDAEKYGTCAGIELISWDFPMKNNLKEMIEQSGFYPVTCITNFTQTEISRLLADDIVLCKSIMEDPNILDRLGIIEKRKASILMLCQKLCDQSRVANRHLAHFKELGSPSPLTAKSSSTVRKTFGN